METNTAHKTADFESSSEDMEKEAVVKAEILSFILDVVQEQHEIKSVYTETADFLLPRGGTMIEG